MAHVTASKVSQIRICVKNVESYVFGRTNGKLWAKLCPFARLARTTVCRGFLLPVLCIQQQRHNRELTMKLTCGSFHTVQLTKGVKIYSSSITILPYL